MPAVLNEGAFVDTQKDIRDWDEDRELKALGEAYARAAAEYLGLEKRALYRVQVGAYREKANGEAALARVKAAGFTDAFLTVG